MKSVEIAKRRENHDAWELADAIYEDVMARVPKAVDTAFGQGISTGTRAAEDEVYEAHRKAGTEIGPTYLRAMRQTVEVWPPEDRLIDKASFVVHSEIRGKDYPNRREVIQKLAAKSSTGRVSWSELRRWKSERKPERFRTFLELAEQRIRRAVNDAGKPWHMVADGDRAAIVKTLRTVAAEIEAGTFGVVSDD